MPCYTCSHCNKCGMFSMQLDLTCSTCRSVVVAGKGNCPECGSAYLHNTTRGHMAKPEGATDYYTKIEDALEKKTSHTKKAPTK